MDDLQWRFASLTRNRRAALGRRTSSRFLPRAAVHRCRKVTFKRYDFCSCPIVGAWLTDGLLSSLHTLLEARHASVHFSLLLQGGFSWALLQHAFAIKEHSMHLSCGRQRSFVQCQLDPTRGIAQCSTTVAGGDECSAQDGLECAHCTGCVQIVRSTIIEHDKDKDGYLNYDEFKALLSREDLNSNVLP